MNKTPGTRFFVFAAFAALCGAIPGGCDLSTSIAPAEYFRDGTAKVTLNTVNEGVPMADGGYFIENNGSAPDPYPVLVTLQNPRQLNIAAAISGASINGSAASNVSIASWTKNQVSLNITGAAVAERYSIALTITSRDNMETGERVWDIPLSIVFHTPLELTVPLTAAAAVTASPDPIAHWNMQDASQHSGITRVVVDFKYFDTGASVTRGMTHSYVWDETSSALLDANGAPVAGFQAQSTGTPPAPRLVCEVPFPAELVPSSAPLARCTFRVAVYDTFGLAAEAKSPGFDSGYGAFQAMRNGQFYATLDDAVLAAATGTPASPDTITVLRDITRVGILDITSGKHVKFTVPPNSSRTITLGAGHTGPLFTVRSGASLTFEGNGTGVLTVDGNKDVVDLGGSYFINVNGGALNLRNGAVLQNAKKTGAQGCIYIDGNGVFTMTGGKINGMEGGRGAVGFAGGAFTMSGGEICGTVTTQNGGGVYSSSAAANRFTMSGGFIRNNSALAGSGVYIWGGEFTMTGGEISGNTATDRGGGVYINASEAIFNMSGGSITGNNKTGSGYGGGGVYMNGGHFTMSGTARIAGNTAASGNGNGVWINNTPVCSFTMSGSAVVNANNNVYLNTGKTLTVDSDLTGAAPVATIKPAVTAVGTQVLNGTAVSANYHKFALDPSVPGSIGNDGRLAP